MTPGSSFFYVEGFAKLEGSLLELRVLKGALVGLVDPKSEGEKDCQIFKKARKTPSTPGLCFSLQKGPLYGASRESRVGIDRTLNK